jgi:hypothetical protein
LAAKQGVGDELGIEPGLKLVDQVSDRDAVQDLAICLAQTRIPFPPTPRRSSGTSVDAIAIVFAFRRRSRRPRGRARDGKGDVGTLWCTCVDAMTRSGEAAWGEFGWR